MTHKRRHWAVLVAAVAAVTIAPLSAARAEEPLTMADLTPETTSTTIDGVAWRGDCFSGDVTLHVWNHIHREIYSYIFRSSACPNNNGTIITNMRWELPYVHVPGWSPWERTSQSLEAKRGGEGEYTAYRRYRAEMKACISVAGSSVCLHDSPYVALRFFANGTYTYGGGTD